MLCAMYLRKSRADAELEREGEFETLKRHETILRDFAGNNDIQIIETYKELVSGENINNRPEMQRLLEDVSDGKYEGVLVVEVERLARGNGIDQCIIIETFKSAGCLIVTPTKTYDCNNPAEEEFFELGLMLSRFEYKTIRKRLDRGRLQSAKEGKLIYKAPFGYDLVKRKLIPNENAKWVRYIFEQYANGVNKAVIADSLNAMNVLTDNNVKWTRYSVRVILSNITYTGDYVYGTTKVIKHFDTKTHQTKTSRGTRDPIVHIKDHHEPIVSHELFEQVQELQKSSATRVRRKQKLQNPLAGLLRCGECGYCFRGEKVPYNNERYYIYIRHSEHCNAGCNEVKFRTPLHKVMTVLICKLKSEIENVKIEIETGNKKDEIEQKRKVLNEQLQENEKKLKKCYVSFENDIYTTEEFLERRKVYQTAMDEIKKNLSELDNVVNTDELKDFSVMLHDVIDSLESDQISTESKNRLLKSIFKEIILTPKEKDFDLKLVFKF